MSLPTKLRVAACGATLLLGACAGERVEDARPADTLAATTPPATATPAPPATTDSAQSPQRTADMRVEVDVDARQLHVSRGGSRIASHGVAVGSSEWPTKTGEWTIRQVVFNPEWIPPKDESWAKDEEEKKPGASDNPLGRIQLVYDPPRSIHGTNEPGSIGKAVSHGSIRVTNAVGLQLARQIMEAAGVPNVDEVMRKGEANRTEKQVVDLPAAVPIRVH